MKERAFELATEGWRRTDLIRWNLLAETLALSLIHIYFEVTKNSRQPFMVRTPQKAVVKVYGTQFNVEASVSYTHLARVSMQNLQPKESVIIRGWNWRVI